jgi:hypothetical protein
VTMGKSYGFVTLRITEFAQYHLLGKLPEPKLARRYYLRSEKDRDLANIPCTK